TTLFQGLSGPRRLIFSSSGAALWQPFCCLLCWGRFADLPFGPLGASGSQPPRGTGQFSLALSVEQFRSAFCGNLSATSRYLVERKGCAAVSCAGGDVTPDSGNHEPKSMKITSRCSNASPPAPSSGRHRIAGVTLVALLALAFSACTRDPNVRKQKFLESGNQYFAKAQYREAAIQYQNALQIDSEFLPAHVQLAQIYVKSAAWRQAVMELRKVLQLDPRNV